MRAYKTQLGILIGYKYYTRCTRSEQVRETYISNKRETLFFDLILFYEKLYINNKR